MGIGRVIMDLKYRPKTQSDLAGHKYTKRLLTDTFMFGWYSVFGGAIIFLCGWLYFLNVDRNLEFNALMSFVLVIGLSFLIALWFAPVISPKILILFACLAVLTNLLIQIQIAEFAATNITYWENRMNDLTGFSFHQSLESAALCGIPIGIIFALFFSYYIQYNHDTKQFGINLEIPFLLLFVFLLAGLVFGHDMKYSGLNVAENLKTAMENFQTLCIIFYVMIGLTLVVSMVALYFLRIQIQTERQVKKNGGI